MSNENVPRETANAVQLFQDAHQKMVMLKRVDEQMAQLLTRRRTLMDELKNVQGQINDEFERMFDLPDETPERLQSIVANVRPAKAFAQALDDDAAVA